MADFWTAEYRAERNGVGLYMYRKRLVAPVRGKPPLPVFFLVHGSSFGGRSGLSMGGRFWRSHRAVAA